MRERVASLIVEFVKTYCTREKCASQARSRDQAGMPGVATARVAPLTNRDARPVLAHPAAAWTDPVAADVAVLIHDRQHCINVQCSVRYYGGVKRLKRGAIRPKRRRDVVCDQ